ncbi:hypothetical protein NE237_004320 [Protea cynaroides]|uniref:Uncharacterized protein n=1 Tax=Protea cynaroides TaxID=273540 RepID=A0A9Q0KJ75_9MAGN|nr:hypothetical protein NE237_004320 [Protea cynaroides]
MQLLASKIVKENRSTNNVGGGDGVSSECNYKSTLSRKLFPNGVKFLFSDVLGGAKKLDDLEFFRSESLSSRSSGDSLNSDQQYFVIKSPWTDAKQNGQQICSDNNLKEIGTTEKEDEEAGEEDEDNKELWRKRILMGKLCRPLNS